MNNVHTDEFERYVKQKLAEAESTADDPENWVEIDELFSAWDSAINQKRL